MIEIFLPQPLTPQFISLIPEQRARINELFQEGTIRSYALTQDRDRLWVILVAASQEEVDSILASFPIMPYSQRHTHELMFHNMASHELPRLSLN